MRNAAIIFGFLVAACGEGEARTPVHAPTRPPIPEAVVDDTPPVDQQQPALGKGKTEMKATAQFSTASTVPRPTAVPAARPMRTPPPPR